MTSGADAAAARHVFISFASADAGLAHRLVDRLEQAGLRGWISDRDIPPAASYPAAITAGIAGSGVVLLLLTEAASGSPHVLREVEIAFNGRTPILPVRVAGATPSADLQYFLSTSQWFDAGAAFDEAEMANLEARLRALLEGRPWIETRRSWRRVAAVAALAAVALAVFVLWRRPPAGETPATGPAATGTPMADPRDPVAPATGTPTTATTGSPAPRTMTNPRDGQTYVWVPPGRFVMGCSSGDPDCAPDEMPAHAVDIEGFWLARTEVTEAQFRRAGAAGRIAGGDGALPASGVSWTAARAHCAAVGGRLPTEAEWEYAARAGTPTRYYDRPQAIAWFADNAEGPRPVATKAPNAFGLHDMLGNVSEWVRDRYYSAYDDSGDPAAVEEPLAGNASGVARGGSWVSDAAGIRVSRRLEMLPDAEEPHIGVRCAADRL